MLEAEQGPLLITGEKGSQRIAVFSFDVHDSDIPLKMDFPFNAEYAYLDASTRLGHDVKYYAGRRYRYSQCPGFKIFMLQLHRENDYP